MSYHSLVFHKNKKVFSQSGFGLIELMVSISIMSIVMAVILVRQSSFNSAVLLRSQAYEVALSLRTVQLSAVSASNDAGDFRDVLGIHFDTSENTDGLFRIFRDDNNNNFYTSSEEFGLQGRLDNRFEIRTIRAGAATPNQISVIFERPNFDARFYTAANTAAGSSVIEIDIARRGAPSPGTCGADFRTVEVSTTGQITVKDC